MSPRHDNDDPPQPAVPRVARRQPGRAHGRYDGRPAPLPPGGKLGRPPRSRNLDTTVAAVTDPMGDGELRHLATVNRRTDLLEHERSHGLISEAAYRNGRIVQAVLERAGRIGGSNWAGASRKDPAEVRDTHAQRLIDDGAVAETWRRRIRDRLGMIDARLIDRVLGEGLSYADCAALVGRAGDRGQRYMASRFRDALEELSEVLVGRGATVPTPDDKHRAAGADAAERQRAAIAGGATLDRLEGELAELVALRVKSAEVRRLIAELGERIAAVRQARAGSESETNIRS